MPSSSSSIDRDGLVPLYDDGHRCKLCYDFDWDALERSPMDATCSTLFRLANDGCRTCKILKTAIESLYRVENPSKTRFEFRVWKVGNEEDDCQDNVWIYPGFNLWETGGPTIDGPCPWKFLEVKHHLPKHTASPESHSWAQEQMKKCLDQHPGCTIGSSLPLLPTRVLDIGDDFSSDTCTIKVLETRGERGKYLALSHCWGDPALMPTKLTAHTLREYRHKIRYNSLPQTFRDAVTFARRMEIQYIWIDSLCIIQRDKEKDSPEDRKLAYGDWMRESSRMCSVYENSYLTLAETVEIKEDDGDNPYQVHARKEVNHYAERFPLLKRGWVTQETLLSPRTLFGESELLWHCRNSKACQCSSGFWGGLERFEEYVKLPKVGLLRERSTKSDLIKKWYELMSNYSLASLTYQTDRLAAVDSIVQYMRPLRDCVYLAGLWSDSLALDLLWSIDALGRKSTRTVLTEPPSRKTQWSFEAQLFPTWSWASIQGKVVWSWIQRLIENCPAEAILVKRNDQPPTSPAYELSLRGVLVPSLFGIVRLRLNDKVAYYPDYDGQDDLESDTKVYCPRILKSGDSYYSLVLLCVDELRGVYERIGFLQFTSEGDGYEADPAPRNIRASHPETDVQGLPHWWEARGGWEPVEVTMTLV